jgi:hypothetical protein
MWQGQNLFRYGTADLTAEAVQLWIDFPGLASFAREYALTSVDDSSDDKTIQKGRDELEHLLAIRPLSSLSWLRLAAVRVDANEGLAKATEALELSAVTGPNEGYVLTERGLFGIWQWEGLSPELKQRAIADLAARQLSDGKLAWMKTFLAGKPEPVRREIRSALEARGFSKSNFERIGL